jgi:hypothetical protein
MAHRREKAYSSRRAFDRDRKRMREAGWLVVDQRVVPIAKPHPIGGRGDFAGCLFVPLLWLWNRYTPDEETVVTYERAAD